MTAPIKEDIIQRQILDAARKLFQVYGFQKVTMDDVAKAIGKGRSSIYYYYKSKEEIFDAVINCDIKEMITVIRNAVDKAVGVQEKIYALCISKLTLLGEKQSFYTTMDMGMDADAITNFNKIKLVHHNLIMKLEGEVLGKILSDGIDNGELKQYSGKEIENLIFVLLSGLRGLKREVALTNKFDQIELIVRTWSNMVVNGLRK